MDQDRTDPAPRPQTLLAAAKAAMAAARFDYGDVYLDLRDAIAREEARPPATTDGERRCWEGLVEEWRNGHDEQEARAQQAEASAAWHKAESERLSGELALTRNQLTLAVERSERLSEQLAGCHYDLGEANKQRQRAEKAEAEMSAAKSDARAKLQNELRSIQCAPSTTAETARERRVYDGGPREVR